MKLNKSLNLQIFDYTAEANTSISGEGLSDLIVKRVPYIKQIGYAGWKRQSELRKNLIWNIGDKTAKMKKVDINVIKEAIQSCNTFLGKRKMYVFVFPTFDNFTIKRMGGIAGCTAYRNTLVLYVNSAKKYKKILKETIVHELAHVICDYHLRKKTLTILDCLINEGIAEHFREYILGGGKSKPVRCISKKKALSILNGIRHLLNKKSNSLYNELFFATGKYPLWAGYAIGHTLIKFYLANYKTSWVALLRTNPKSLFSKIELFGL